MSRTRRDDLLFSETPYPLWTRRAAAGLGAGSYEVATLVDGNLMASDRLTITAH